MCRFVTTKHNTIDGRYKPSNSIRGTRPYKSFPPKSRVRKRAAISSRDSQVEENGHQINSVHGAKAVKTVSLNMVSTASSSSMVRWHLAESNLSIEASLHPKPASIRLNRRVRNMYKCLDILVLIKNVYVGVFPTNLNSDSFAHSAYRWTPKLLTTMVNRNEVTTINLSIKFHFVKKLTRRMINCGGIVSEANA